MTGPLMESAARVVEGEYYLQRQPHLAIEPDAGFAYYDDEGRLTIHYESIASHLHHAMIVPRLGLEPDKLRPVQNPQARPLATSSARPWRRCWAWPAWPPATASPKGIDGQSQKQGNLLDVVAALESVPALGRARAHGLLDLSLRIWPRGRYPAPAPGKRSITIAPPA